MVGLMADISMCLNNKCSKHTKCYRFNAIANDRWQSYSNFKEKDWKECFIPMNKKNINKI